MKEYEYNGESHTLSMWSRILGIPSGTLYTRIMRGWPLEEALRNPDESPCDLNPDRQHRPKLYGYDGKYKTAQEWARFWGVSRKAALSRIRRRQMNGDENENEKRVESICWGCIHSWLDYSKGRGCSWSYDFEMVDGAEYQIKDTYTGQVTVITKCPKFKRREKRRGR